MRPFYGIECLHSYWDDDTESMLVSYDEGTSKCIANFFALCDYMWEEFRKTYGRYPERVMPFEDFVKANQNKAVDRVKYIGEWKEN